MSEANARVLDLEGVHNFRDYGGYAVSGGGRLKRGILWRSGEHHDATDADIARIAALNLSSVFDLRTSKERSARPCRRPADFTAKVLLSADPATPRTAPHIDAARTLKERTPAETRAAMNRNYYKIAFRPELIAMMRLLLAELAQGEGASLVNCMAGKDRTGITVAMVQLAAGVHHDDVVADYVLTNSVGNEAARIAAGAASLRAVRGDINEESLRVLMGVEAEYLDTAFTRIAELHGSVDGYIDGVLGFGPAERERLRASLIEG